MVTVKGVCSQAVIWLLYGNKNMPSMARTHHAVACQLFLCKLFLFVNVMSYFFIYLQHYWTSIVHHVAGEHEWAMGACLHSDLTEAQGDCDKQLLEFGSACHQKLTSIVMARRFLSSLDMYINCRYVMTSNFGNSDVRHL